MSQVRKNKSLSVDLLLKRSARLREKQALRDLKTENRPDQISSLDIGAPAPMGFRNTRWLLVRLKGIRDDNWFVWKEYSMIIGSFGKNT